MARPKRLPAPVTSTAGEEAIRVAEGMNDNQTTETQAKSLATGLQTLIRKRLQADGGWLSFDRFMALALYAASSAKVLRFKANEFWWWVAVG